VGKIAQIIARFLRHVRRFCPPYGARRAEAARHVARLDALAEKYYDEMYETHSLTGCYADMKDCFTEAISVAEMAGLSTDAERLRKRLDHCKEVYRKHFLSS
jgi:hypothetical protein